MEKLLISACMLGIRSRYDGESKKCISDKELDSIAAKYELVPFCPEIYGGLPTPRVPSERVGNSVLMKDGSDVTENYERGADQALYLCRALGIRAALLKSKSPSCGKDEIYDGSFTGTLTGRSGVAAELLMSNGIRVYSEKEIKKLI